MPSSSDQIKKSIEKEIRFGHFGRQSNEISSDWKSRIFVGLIRGLQKLITIAVTTMYNYTQK